jgi:hypothetical protein
MKGHHVYQCCKVKFEIFMIVISLSLVRSPKTIYFTLHDSRKVARST